MGEPRRFFITGAASGIGRFVADTLIERGHYVFATDANCDGLRAHAQKAGWPEERTWALQLDVRDADAWERVFLAAVHAMGQVDVCINNAGVMRTEWTEEISREDIDLQIDVNFKGVVFGTQQALRHMKEREAGRIVNIASMASLAPIPGMSVYCATKYAVRAFTLATSAEARAFGVHCVAVCPDAVNTPLLNQRAEARAADIVWSGPRLLTVGEIGEVVIRHSLDGKRLVVVHPSWRGLLARVSDLYPSMMYSFLKYFQSKGQKARAKWVGP